MDKTLKKIIKILIVQLVTSSMNIKDDNKKEGKYFIIDYKKIFNNSDAFIEKYYKNYLDTEIKIGSENQEISLGITFNSFGTFLYSSKLKNTKNVIIYDETKSKTFILKEEEEISDTYYLMGSLCSDSILIGNQSFSNYTFILADRVNGEYSYHLNGKIGLRLTTNTNYDEDYEANIFYVLKRKNIIKNNLFYFEFNENNNDNGKLILGIYPHDLNPLKYNKSNLTLFKIDKFEHSYQLYFYCHKFLKLIIFNKNNIKYPFKNSTVLFDIDLGLILGTNEYHNYIKENFFNKFINESKCEPFKHKGYTFYKCNPNINLNNFESLYFYIDEENYLVLAKNDLFIKYNNILYFIIGFKKSTDYWNFGINIFKKYTFIFDIDQKQIGFYKIINNKEEEQKNSNENSVENQIKKPIIVTNVKYIRKGNIYLVIIIIFLIFIILILLKLFYKKFKFLRKERPNELKEYFYYISENDNNTNNT